MAYTLSEAADDGHCYLPAPNLIADAAKILDVPSELVAPGLDELAAAEGVIREAVPASAQAALQVPAVYLPPFYQAERSVARALLRLLAARADRLSAFAAVDWDNALGWLRGRFAGMTPRRRCEAPLLRHVQPAPARAPAVRASADATWVHASDGQAWRSAQVFAELIDRHAAVADYRPERALGMSRPAWNGTVVARPS